tara:strand:+ start:651 stop:962 length:312 start_codon:yes stop_codon:yes gene_type:complete
MEIQKENSWAVMYRDLRYKHMKEWKTEAWYPSIIIDTINGNKIEDPEHPMHGFDMGEVRAAHHALRASQRMDIEYKIEKVYFKPHDKDKDWSYEGTQREVFNV